MYVPLHFGLMNRTDKKSRIQARNLQRKDQSSRQIPMRLPSRLAIRPRIQTVSWASFSRSVFFYPDRGASVDEEGDDSDASASFDDDEGEDWDELERNPQRDGEFCSFHASPPPPRANPLSPFFSSPLPPTLLPSFTILPWTPAHFPLIYDPSPPSLSPSTVNALFLQTVHA